MIIGLLGYAQSGKDSTAATLVEEFGFTRLAFADRLRECVYALNPYIGSFGDGELPLCRDDQLDLRLQLVVDTLGWDEAKQLPEVRRLLQVFGTEVGRELIDGDIWLNAVRKQMRRAHDYVITDVRFPNEAQAVRSWYGQLWRIQRPGTAPVNPHSSETALDNVEVDRVISNDGSLDSLRDLVRKALA